MATQGDRLQTTQKNQLHNAGWGFVLNDICACRSAALCKEIHRSDEVTSHHHYGIEQGGTMFMEKGPRMLPVLFVQIPLLTPSYRLPQNGTGAPRRSPA
jgi:hypothetical protein